MSLVHSVYGFFAGIALVAGPVAAARECPPDKGPFSGPAERVVIAGYDGDAMEPFLSRDGRILLFNNLNGKGVNTNLHWAARTGDLSFAYGGEIEGANTDALEGVPTLDAAGTLYFVSTRSYPETLSSLYRANFQDGRATDVRLVEGASRKEMGIVNFDVEASADGKTLYAVDGRFDGGPWPREADFVIVRKSDERFERREEDRETLAALNTGDLDYAAAVSADECELFFTRMRPVLVFPQFAAYRSVRPDTDAPFGSPQRIDAIRGYAEAPTVSPDGRALYYHAKRNGRFVIERVAR